MRKCRVCLHDIDDASRICEHCGEDLIRGRRPTAAGVTAPVIASPVPAPLATSTTKNCPFCAETIQAAAIVCKHCGRDVPILAPVATTVTATASRSPKSLNLKQWGLVSIGASFILAMMGVPAISLVGWGLAVWGIASLLTGSRIVRYGAGLVLGGLVVGVGASLTRTATPYTPAAPALPYSSTGAALICRQFVEKRLKAPSTAKFPYTSEATITDNGGGKYRVLTYVDSQNGFGAMLRNNYDCSVHWTGGTSWSLDNLEMRGR